MQDALQSYALGVVKASRQTDLEAEILASVL